jgi:sugar-specific transcriptional regulator TrmB
MTIFKIYLKKFMATKLSKPIKNYLTDFGLNDKEIELYMTLLKTGPSTIMDLSRESGIKRSTTHNNVEELIKKGLVSQTNYGERRMVVAEDPGKLQFLMEQKKWDLKKLEENMPDIVSLIKENVPQTNQNGQVQMKYYMGKKNVEYIYQLILNANKIYSFVNVEPIKRIFPENFELFKVALKKNENMEMWEILQDPSNKTETTNVVHERYHYAYVPEGVSLSDFDFIIFDDNVAMINVEESNPIAILIESSSMAEGLKAIHKIIWKVLAQEVK